MIVARVEIRCDVCGKMRSAAGTKMVVASGLEPAWTGWEAVEAARADDWMIDPQKNTVYCEEHGPDLIGDGTPVHRPD